MIRLIILFLLISGSAWGQNAQVSPVAGLDQPNTAVVNNNFQQVQTGVNGIFGLFSKYFTSGILNTNAGGTGKDFSAVPKNNIPYFSAIGTMGNVGIGTNGQVFTYPPSWTTLTYSGIAGNYAAGTYLIAGPSEWLNASTDSSFHQEAEYRVPRGGTLTIKFNLKNNTNTQGRVYRNGVAVGTLRSGSTAEFSEDISGWTAGDLCQLYLAGATGTDLGGDMRIYENAPVSEIASSSFQAPIWHFGNRAPDGTIGNIGDIYTDITGPSAVTTFYVKTAAATWTAK